MTTNFVTAALDNIFPVGVFMSFPLLMTQINGVPQALEAQGWLITVVACAMGLVRIGLWLRGIGTNGSSKDAKIIEKILDQQATLLEKVSENNGRIIENQQQLSQMMEIHKMILEDIKDFMKRS